MSRGHTVAMVIDRAKAASQQSPIAVYPDDGPMGRGLFQVEFMTTVAGRRRAEADPRLICRLDGSQPPEDVREMLRGRCGQ